MAQNAGNSLMDSAQLAAYLGWSERQLEELRTRDEGPPFFRLGHRSIRYRKSDVDKWLRGRRVVPVEADWATLSGGNS